MNEQIKSRERVAQFGEVYTALREVNAMLDLVKQEAERPESRFLEPACGTGNFLVEALRRKLAAARSMTDDEEEFERLTLISVASLYGIDILEDNLVECRARLMNTWAEVVSNNICYRCRQIVQRILAANITRGNFLTGYRVDDRQQDTPEPVILTDWTIEPGRITLTDYPLPDLLAGEDDLFSGAFRADLTITPQPNQGVLPMEV